MKYNRVVGFKSIEHEMVRVMSTSPGTTARVRDRSPVFADRVNIGVTDADVLDLDQNVIRPDKVSPWTV